MKALDLLFVDANTLWHRRLAEALGEYTSTLALLPRSGILPGLGVPMPVASGDGTNFLPIRMIRGWASTSSPLAQRWLAYSVLRKLASEKTVAVLATPAYRVLAHQLRGNLPYIYYCADDYRGYSGWGSKTAEAEAEMCGGAALSVFVSEALRARAVAEYGLSQGKTLVSPNATEPRFAGASDMLPAQLKGCPRPILGVLGALSDRLDLDLVRRAAELPEVGTFLIAGPIQSDLTTLDWLANSKVLVAGRIPHEEIHRWALAMDAALIPYADTPLNYHCSPMRLYDHLATGVPIFASDTCDQVSGASEPGVCVLPRDQLLAAIQDQIGCASATPLRNGIFWADRARVLVSRIGAAAAAGEQRIENQ